VSPRSWQVWKSAAAERKRPSPASIACTATWSGGSISWNSSWASATAEEQQRTRENEQLEVERERLTEARRGALEEAAQSTEEARLLREQLKDLEHNLKVLRSEMDAFREARSTRSAHTAKLAVELEYMEAACVSDLGIEASELRQQRMCNASKAKRWRKRTKLAAG